MRILLVRHGRSQSQSDWTVNQRVADHAIELSPEGHQQANECGTFLNDWLHENVVEQMETVDVVPKIRLWQSPYTRTRQTAAAIFEKCVTRQDSVIASEDRPNTIIRRKTGAPLLLDIKESLHLHEQQFGIFDGLSDEEREKLYPREHAYYEKCRRFEGKLWPKMPLGESRVDVAMRVHQAFGTFHRDKDRHGIHDLIVVAHGTVNRAFLMMWLHLEYEWMDQEPNPQNCSVRLIEDGQDKGYIFEGFREPEPINTPETEE